MELLYTNLVLVILLAASGIVSAQPNTIISNPMESTETNRSNNSDGADDSGTWGFAGLLGLLGLLGLRHNSDVQSRTRNLNVR